MREATTLLHYTKMSITVVHSYYHYSTSFAIDVVAFPFYIYC